VFYEPLCSGNWNWWIQQTCLISKDLPVYFKNPRDLYRITRQIAKKSFINATSAVRGKDGKQLTAVEEQVQRWQDHFGEILSTSAQEHEHEVNTTEHPLVINEKTPPKHTEIVKAIK